MFGSWLGEHIELLTTAMQDLAARISSGNEEAIRPVVDAFLKKLQGGAGDKLEQVAAILGGLVGQLEGLQHGLAEAASRMTTAAEAVARLAQAAQAIE